MVSFIFRKQVEMSTKKSFFFFDINDTFFMKLSYSTAITTGCSPTCGADAFCGESSGRSVCTCNPGYQGDGYSCTGWCQLVVSERTVFFFFFSFSASTSHFLPHLSQFTDIKSHKEGSKFCLVGKATAVITLSEKYHKTSAFEKFS